MANLPMIEDVSSLEIKPHSDSRFSSFQNGNTNWHEIGSISLSCDVTTKVMEEIDESEKIAEAGDDGGRRSFNSKTRLEINGNMIEVGLMPNDALIYSFPRRDSTWSATSLVTPLSSDIIALPLSNHPSMATKGGDVDTSEQHQHPQKQVNQGECSRFMEYILILSHLAIFGIVGIFIRYALQILFGPDIANVTNHHSALYINLPSNMVGSFFMGWVGVVFKTKIYFLSEALAIGLSTGLMGSITTFTSWIQEIVNLTTERHWVTGIIGLLLGMELSQMSLILGIESANLIEYIHNKFKKKHFLLKWISSNEYNQFHLYGFIVLMFITGIFWGGSFVLLVFDFTSHHKKKIWIACIVGPFGVWIRWFMARLNGRGIGAQKNLKWLPLGTLITNLMASIMMATLSTIHLVVKDHTWKFVIEGLQLGFLGCMSTVSTFVVEVRAMHQSSHSWRAYVYILLSLFPAFTFGTLIYSIPIWTRTVEHVEVSVQEEVGEEDAEKAEEGNDKVENPPAIAVDPLVPEKNAKKEKVWVKVEVKSKANNTAKKVKGKKVIDDPKLIQGPINLASLSPIQKLQLTSFAKAKASEGLLKSHTKDNKHFESFEKSTNEKVQNEFNAKRLQNLKRMIAKDKATLGECVKRMQDALSKGGNLYKSCLSLNKFTTDIEKKSKVHENELECISQSVDSLEASLSSHENQVICLEKIRSLNYDREIFFGRVGEARSLITPTMDIMMSALRDTQDALASHGLEDIKKEKAQSYLLNGFITMLENLHKG
ncbi:uncharacterized protein LOC131046319 [Cryptomeria japonica]|uniref:uncharacterized protein LOC131046319 n=1 Tax=Cryptomeria japonica TaxID=3369 RepID=UPI0027D9E208|nr:uncharacterized protein LOC131046319 [Cryptomeria japonica]